MRRHAAADEMRHAIDERARLPRAGAGDDQERAIAVRGRGQLAGVQLLREVGGGHRPQFTASYWMTSERQVQPPSAF